MFKFVQIFHSKQNFQRFRLELSRCDKETKTDHGVSKVRARKRHVFYVSYPGKFSKYHSLTVFFLNTLETIEGNLLVWKIPKITNRTNWWLAAIYLDSSLSLSPTKEEGREEEAIVPSNGNTRYKVSPRNSTARIIVVLGPLSPPAITFPST